MMFHRISDGGRVRRTSRQRHDIAEPVQFVCVEVASDEARPRVTRRLLDDRLQLIETFRRVNAGIEMRVPDTQATPRGLHVGRHGKAAAITEAEIACLQPLDLDIGNWIAAYESQALIVNAWSGRLK